VIGVPGPLWDWALATVESVAEGALDAGLRTPGLGGSAGTLQVSEAALANPE
jgi:hypothetical protein